MTTYHTDDEDASIDDAIRAAEEWLDAANAPGGDPKDRPRAFAALQAARSAKHEAKKQSAKDAEAYHRRPAAPYPIDALGKTLGNGAKAIAAKTRCPDAIAANSVLAVASLAAQGVANVQHPEGFMCAASIYALTIAESGERKTTADNEAMAPVRDWEASLRRDYAQSLSTYERSLATWASQHKKITSSKTMSRDEQDEALKALGDKPGAPRGPYLTIANATQEGIIRSFQTSQPALGLFSNEGGQVLCGHGFKKENKVSTASVLSSLWDGGEYRQVRAGTGTIVLHDRRLAAHLLVQPDIAMTFLSDDDIGGQGFTARFLAAYPESNMGTRFLPDVPDAAATREIVSRLSYYASHVERLFAEQKTNLDGSELEFRILTLSPAAVPTWRCYHNDVEREHKPGGRYADMKAFASKSAEQCLRIAATLTLFEKPRATEIDCPTIERAVVLARWYLDEARRLFQRAPKEVSDGRDMLKWIKTLPMDSDGSGRSFTLRQAQTFGPGRLRANKDHLRGVLDSLGSEGLVTLVTGKRWRLPAMVDILH